MAKQLGTGKDTGTVAGSKKAERLIGGTPQVGAGAPIAQREIKVAALQPKAEMVNTFFESKGPTLGGATVVPKPPDLPAAPQDLAALAKSLGSFNETLGAFGDSFITYQKMRDKQAKQRGQEIARDLQVKFPGQSFVEIRDGLYRKIAAGEADEQAIAAYQYLKSLSPIVNGFTNQALQSARMREQISTAQDRFRSTGTFVGTDGQKYERAKLKPNDPQIQALIRGLVEIPNDPNVVAENEALLFSTYSNITASQAAAHNQRNYAEGANAMRTGIRTILNDPNLRTGQERGDALTKLWQKFYVAHGAEDQAELIKELPTIVGNVVAELSRRPNSREVDLQLLEMNENKGAELLRYGRRGPNGDLLIKSLGAKGGLSAAIEMIRQSREQVAVLTGAVNQTDDYIAQQRVSELMLELGINAETAKDSVAFSQAKIQLTQSIEADPALQTPARRRAALALVTTLSGQLENLVTGSVAERARQELAAIDNRQDLSLDEKLSKMLQVQAPEAVRSPFISRIEAQQQVQNGPAAEEQQRLIRAVAQDYIDGYSASGNTKGMQPNETKFVNQKRREMDEAVLEIYQRAKREGRPQSQARAEAQEYLQKELDKSNAFKIKAGAANPAAAGGGRPFVTQTQINEFEQRYNKIFSGLTQQQRKNIKSLAQSGDLFSEKELKRELGYFFRTGNITPQLKFILKTAGYEKRILEFFKTQWKNTVPDNQPFPDLTPDQETRMNELQASAQQSRSNPVNTAFNQAATVALNLVAPPAQAKTFDPAVDSGLGPTSPSAIRLQVQPAVTPTGTPPPYVRPTATIGNYAVRVAGVPDTGPGFAVPGAKDAYGRPVVLSVGLANALHQAVVDSGGVVKYSDIASAKRSRAKNNSLPGAAADSNHLYGDAIDIHGTSLAWLKKHGAKYGIIYLKYPGGDWHFDYRGPGRGRT